MSRFAAVVVLTLFAAATAQSQTGPAPTLASLSPADLDSFIARTR